METSLPESNNKRTHQQARAYGHELLRRNVIEAASYLLVREGPDALTVRRIAQELDCSTKIIYTMFKGKDGLADALYLEGCSRLQEAIGRVHIAPNPADYLWAIAEAYWSFALENPSYYLVMFCGAIPNFKPSPNSLIMTMNAFDTIVGILRQYMAQGQLAQDNAYLLAKGLWSSLHGIVSLYLMGHIDSIQDARAVLERTVHALISSLVPGWNS